MSTRLADLWASSALIQGLMALASLAAIIYLAVQQLDIPDVLTAVVMGIVGFYFGQKNAINRTQHRQNNGGS